MKYHFKIHKEDSGYWAECLELEGCSTQGDSLEDLQINMEEAVNLYLSEPANSNIIFPMPNEKLKKNKNILEVQVDPSVAVAVLIRQVRINKKKTQREMTKLLGLKSLSAYQKFENPKTTNPELNTLKRLKKLLPELKLNLLW